jgi:8-oxo-dGTP pyrophosphatase MutT (NUDIX family)
MDYINYHVEVTPDGQWVHMTVRHPDGTEAGQPRGPFCWPRVKDEVRALADKVAQKTASRREIEWLGELLFGTLFCDPAVAEHFRSTLRRARDQEQGLRLELDFDETWLSEVAALPWELLRAHQTAGYPAITLATDPNLVLSRRRSLWEPPARVTKTDPWRILLAVAAPNDPDLGPVAYEEVLQELQILTQQPRMGFEPLGEPLLNADAPKLDQALARRPDILHFIGHGRFVPDPADPHGELAMVGSGGWTEWLRDEDFSSLLQRHVPAVVFLQACEGGTLSSARGLAGVASKVVQHNAPVVVAMQYPISNATALVFARTFYERLAAGDPVDKAAQEGRRRIALGPASYNTRDFATPVLFMRVPDGHLFQSSPGLRELGQIEVVVQEGVSEEVREIAQRLNYMLEVATGSTEHIDELVNFSRSTNWYSGNTNAFWKKISSAKHPSLYELLRRYSDNDKMQVRIGNKDIYFPQELISGGIQGKFEDVFVKFQLDSHYNPILFRYAANYEKACSDLEERRKSLISKEPGRRLYNSANLRLSNLEIVREEGRSKIRTAHQPVYYYTGLGTNYSLDDFLPDGKTTLRDLVHGEDRRLWPLYESIMANPTGIGLLITSRDNLIILQQRDMSMAVRPGEACSSASGTVDKADTDTLRHHPILKAVYREALEEIGLEENQIGGVFSLGAVREFLRGGLPDFFFAAKVDLRQDQIVDIAKHSGKNIDKWEWEDIPDFNILPPPITRSKVKSFEDYLKGYLDTLSRLEQPPSLPLLTNIILLAEFQSKNPDVF